MMSPRAMIYALLAFAGTIGGYVAAHWSELVR